MRLQKVSAPQLTQLSSSLFKTKWQPLMYVTKFYVSIVWHWSCFKIMLQFPISRWGRPVFCWHEGQGPQQYRDTSISRCLSRYAWELLTHRPMSNERCDQEQRCFSCLLFSPCPFFIVFFRALHQFFRLWTVERGVSKLTDPHHTRLDKIKRKEDTSITLHEPIPCCESTGRSAAATAL